MKKIKFLSIAATLAAAMVSATPSFAASASFSKEGNPGYLSLQGLKGITRFSTSTSNFPSGTLSKTKTITSVQYSYGMYANGAAQQIEICMTKAYSSTYEVCQVITASQNGQASAFVGKVIAAGKDIHIIHTLSGGTYPTTAPKVNDKITVNFSYN